MKGRTERPAWLRYGTAFVLVVLASALAVTLRQWLWPTLLAPYYGAVALAVWYGGLGPGLTSIGFSLLAIPIWVLQPVGTWSIGWSDLSGLFIFAAVSLLVTALTAGRDRAEAEMWASERRFRTMLETANEGIWLIDRDARTQYANDRMAALLGTTPDRLTAVTVLDFVFPEDVPAARERIDRNLAGHSEEFDFRFRRAGGDEVLVVAGTSPVRDGAGRVVGALGLFTDVTARRRAEDALRLLDEAGRALASSLDYEQTLQRVAWLAVPALADWCAVDLFDDGVARRVAVAHADPQQAPLAAALQRYSPSLSSDGPEAQVIRTGSSFFLETATDELIESAAESAEHLEVLRSIGIVSAIVAPLSAGGAVHGALTLYTTTISHRWFDEDDLALAEQLARRSAVAIQNARLYRDVQAAEARYRGLFEGTNDGIIVFDPDGTCVDVNPAMMAMVGYDRTELVGRAATLVACGGPWAGEEGERLRRDGEWRGEFELLRKNGSPMPVESSITSVRLPTGSVYVGVLRDVSERRRFEQLQEEFLSALRLNTALESIDVASARMTRLLDELADVMRLRSGQEIELHRESTDLVALARRAAAEQDRITEQHAIHLESAVDELIGFWDGPRLERVLGNLLGNAIKYSPDGGEITVRIARDEGDDAGVAVLSVEDRGVGIPAADQSHIFEPFRRAGNVESIAGSGIGLAGAKRIVELHDGTITVRSSEGEGSTFAVRLPIAANVQARTNR
ncbi:MAG: multi-sensor signal transduction histidine kinase [Thermomicrobiales bacterium]|nr:multi-sensor signal transduction histidine kinase [Thermomicrobiales bacterium]